jgi:hypothetical protein
MDASSVEGEEGDGNTGLGAIERQAQVRFGCESLVDANLGSQCCRFRAGRGVSKLINWRDRGSTALASARLRDTAPFTTHTTHVPHLFLNPPPCPP